LFALSRCNYLVAFLLVIVPLIFMQESGIINPAIK